MLCLKSSCASFGNAVFGSGTKLTVLDPLINVTEPDVKILPPSPKEICAADSEKGNVTLVCVATNFYPDHVTVSWEINDENVTTGVGTDNSAHRFNDKQKYRISSRLRVPKSIWQNTTYLFTCSVKFFNGTHYNSVTDRIYGNNLLSADKLRRNTATALFAYIIFLGKSMLYALVVGCLVWKIRGSNKKAMTE